MISARHASKGRETNSRRSQTKGFQRFGEFGAVKDFAVGVSEPINRRNPTNMLYRGKACVSLTESTSMSGPCAATSSATSLKAGDIVSQKPLSKRISVLTSVAGQSVCDGSAARRETNLNSGFLVVLARPRLGRSGSGRCRYGWACVWESLTLSKRLLSFCLLTSSLLVGFDLRGDYEHGYWTKSSPGRHT